MGQKGFTLIELIAVLVILGITAAIVVPRFVSLSEQAEVATNSATASALASAVTLANAQWLAQGSPGRIQNLDGVIDMSTNGWPIGTNKGNANDNVGRGNNGCFQIWNYLLISGPRAGSSINSDYQSFRHTGNRQCAYIYRGNGDTAGRTTAQLGINYNSTTGQVVTCGQAVGRIC